MTKHERIPAGRLGRLARMTAVGARAGMSALLRPFFRLESDFIDKVLAKVDAAIKAAASDPAVGTFF